MIIKKKDEGDYVRTPGCDDCTGYDVYCHAYFGYAENMCIWYLEVQYQKGKELKKRTSFQSSGIESKIDKDIMEVLKRNKIERTIDW